MGPDRPQRGAGPPCPHRPLPNPAPGSRRAPLVLPLRARLLAGHCHAPRQRAVQAGAPEPPGRGVLDGVGSDHDRRAEGVLRGGARTHGGDLLGGGDGEGQEGLRRDARVPARCGSEGGEGLRRGVSLPEAVGQRRGQALALRDSSLG